MPAFNGRQRLALAAGATSVLALMLNAPRIVIARGVYLSAETAGEGLARVVDMRTTLTLLACIVVATVLAVLALGKGNERGGLEIDELRRRLRTLEEEMTHVESHITEPETRSLK